MTDRPGVRAIDYADHRRVRFHGAEYWYLHAGDGPLVMLLHGFPDNAYSWEHQIRSLSRAGYRTVAPFLRGYPPTCVNDGASFDRATLARDVIALAEAVGGDGPFALVGQDWGAAIGWGVLGAFPKRVRCAVILAVPHPLEIRRTLRRSPRHVIRSFHWFLFQLPWLPEALIRGSRGGFLRWLWRLWSVDFDDAAHVDQVIETLLAGRGVEDSLAYYRAALQRRYRDPRLDDLFQRLDRPVEVPTLALCGTHDMRREMLPRQATLFASGVPYQWRLVPDAGHFLHREQPEAINRAILEWIQAPPGGGDLASGDA